MRPALLVIDMLNDFLEKWAPDRKQRLVCSINGLVSLVRGEQFEEKPGPRYPGGLQAQVRLQGKRFYAYYQRDELLSAFHDFEILHEQKLIPGDGGFEFWLCKAS